MADLTFSIQNRRSGSVLISTLFVVTVMTMLLSAIPLMTLSSYRLSQADRDRVAALAAAEAGLNWQIARINNRLWDKDDSGNMQVDGSGNPTIDYWPTETGTAPSTASTRVLLTDGSGQWSQRFLTGTSVNPLTVGAGASFTIISEGQVRASDGHIVRRRVKAGGGGLFSLFDTAAIFAFAPYTPASSTPAWDIAGSSTITGGCGSNGYIYGNGGPTITVGPLGLWGSSASMSGVTLASGATQFTRSSPFKTETADEAANLFRLGITSGSGVVGWRPTGYSGGNAIGAVDKYGRAVNSQAEVVDATTGQWLRSVSAMAFLDNAGEPLLKARPHNTTIWGSGEKLRLKPGVYYFAKIDLQNNDIVEIANDWYTATGALLYNAMTHASSGITATAEDYNSDRNRITVFVDAISFTGNGQDPYAVSEIGSGLYTALQGAYDATTNPLRYRRPGNFRIYAKNVGDFSVSGSNNSSYEFNANVLHYNNNSVGGYYGNVTLRSGCHLYGGLFAWTVDISGGSTVEQYGSGVFSGNDPLTVVPTGGSTSGSSGSGGSGGTGSGYGGWLWQELPTN
jgi:Tfp pilus assembly protein PilX